MVRTRSEPSTTTPCHHQIHCWYHNLVQGELRNNKYFKKEAPQHALGVSPEVQHPKAVLKAERGRQGLVSIRVTIQDETTMILEYVREMVPNDDLLSECLRQQKPSDKKEEEERPSWRDKPLHRLYH